MIQVKKYQQEGFNKLLPLNKALLAAKCRYGKSYLTGALADAWGCKLIIIMSGYNVRKEWTDLAKALEINSDHIITEKKDFKNFIQQVKTNNYQLPDDNIWLIFATSQKLTRDSTKELIDENTISDGGILNKLYKNYLGSKLFTVDECQFFEQTIAATEVIKGYEELDNINAHLLYLSATPYRESIQTKFDDSNSYYWSYEDEWTMYENGQLEYKPIKLEVRILTACAKLSLNDDITSADWLKALQDKQDANIIVETLIREIRRYRKPNHLAKCGEREIMFALRDAIINYRNSHPYLAINVETTEAANYNSENAIKFFEAHPNEINIIATAEKLGVGNTIKPLYSVSFFYAVNSPIDLTQTGFRTGSQEDDDGKELTGIILFNKFNALNTIRKVIKLERHKDPEETPDEREFAQATKHMPVLIEEGGLFRAVDFAEVASTKNYKKGDSFFAGETGYFNSITDAEQVFNIKMWLDFNNREIIDKAAKELARAQKKGKKVTPEDIKKAKEIITNALADPNRGANEANQLLEAAGSKHRITTEDLSPERILKRMEESFIDGAEVCYDCGTIDLNLSGVAEIIDNYDYTETMQDFGFKDDFCLNFVKARPDILTGIIRTLKPIRGY